MNIIELIEKLQEIEKTHGKDIELIFYTNWTFRYSDGSPVVEAEYLKKHSES